MDVLGRTICLGEAIMPRTTPVPTMQAGGNRDREIDSRHKSMI